MPPKGRNHNLDKFVSTVQQFPVEQLNANCVKNNFKKSEWNAIENLKNDDNIIIKEADKGGAVVIMDRDYYKSMCLSMLEDSKYYEKIQTYDSKEVMKKLETIVDKHGQKLTAKEADYLLSFNVKTSNFYGLPKIHKNQVINDKCKNSDSSYISVESPTDLKIRPIVAGPSCETHRISYLLDVLLKPYVDKVQSYIRDTIDFLNTIPEKVNTESILVSFDVTNLYSNIPHELGLAAIEHWIHRFPNLLNDIFPKEFVLKSLKLILENNFMHFNEMVYRQKLGTAMGTKVAPTYATLVLGFLEEKLYSVVKDKFGQNFETFIRTSWKRYLDDCFIIWDKGEDQLKQFFDILNSLSPTMKFTMESDTNQLAFLDVMVMKKESNIVTDIFYKITDTKQYLLFDSCHPKHTRNNIPYNLARRLCTIISDTEILNIRLAELEKLLLQRRYPKKLIENGINKAKLHERKDLLKAKNKSKNCVIPYVSTHNPKNPEVFQIIKNNLPIIEADPCMKKVLENSQIIKSKRQSPSLKSILTRACFTSNIKESPIISKCNKPRCATCPYITQGSDFVFKNGSKFTVKSSMTCVSSNLIYVITCAGCGENYIGQTGDTLRHRMTVHRQQIREPKYQCTHVSEHIRNCAKNVSPNFTVFPFYKFHKDTTEKERETKEKLFIQKYKPLLNAT